MRGNSLVLTQAEPGNRRARPGRPDGRRLTQRLTDGLADSWVNPPAPHVPWLNSHVGGAAIKGGVAKVVDLADAGQLAYEVDALIHEPSVTHVEHPAVHGGAPRDR